MKSIKPFKIYVFASLLLCAACSKKLDLTPASSYNTEDFYKTDKDLRQALYGAYGGLRSIHGYEYPLLMEGLSDNTNTALNTTNTPTARFGFTSGDDRILAVWSAYWTIINRTNQILDHIDAATFVNEASRPILKGETQFIRAYCYFQLGWIFGGMPLIDHVISAEETAKTSRSTQEETFQFAATELQAAAAVLPDEQTGDNLGRATKYAANGILARLYLYTKNYAAAKPVLEAILANSNLTPYASFEDCFLNTKDNGSEHVFQIQYTSGLNSQGNPLVYSLVPENIQTDLFPKGGRSTWLAVSNDLYENYEEGDLRRDITIQKGYTTNNNVVDQNTLLFIKFAHGSIPDKKEDNDVNLSIVRITDVQLMYAEVLNELGYQGSGQALTLINDVRHRAGLAALGATDAPSQETFREVLYKERRLEFAGEFLRWFDIVRQGPDKATSIFADFLKRPEEGGGTTKFDAHYLLMPIPDSEIRNNPALTQNPGY
ncbi:Starch-binding associating with outer membrane [bacterium A37T11]|nr:Starch-binding associating with outer membrane [bacterium A37T11]